MTMKTKKTLAAALAVLLTFCLVFMAPAAATTTEDCSGSCNHVVAIGNTHYDTLQDAVYAATGGSKESLVEIKFLKKDVEVQGTGIVVGGTQSDSGVTTATSEQHIKIDFNDCTYNVTSLVGSGGTVTNCFQLLKGSTVYLMNGGIKVSETVKSSDPSSKYSSSYTAIGQQKGSAIIIQNYADLTLEDMILDGSGLSFEGGCNYVLSAIYGTISITGDTVITAKGASDEYAEDLAIRVASYSSPYSSGSHTTIDSAGVVVNGKIAHDGNIPPVSTLTITRGTFTDPNALKYLGENAEVTVTLKDDVQVSETITVSKGKATLDLGQKKITTTLAQETPIIILNGGELTVKNGEITHSSKIISVYKGTLILDSGSTLSATASERVSGQAVNMYGDSSADGVHSKFIMKEGATITGKNGVVIRSSPSAKGIVLEINGIINTDSSGIWVIGTVPKTDCPEITIGTTADISSSIPLSAMGYAKWTINGGTFTGSSEAMGIKGGEITIENGKFTAKGEYKDPANANNNGSESTGAALSIASNDEGYPSEITVTIKNGEFISTNGHAVYEGIGLVACTTDNCDHSNCVSKDGNYFVKGADGNPKLASDDSHLESITINGGKFQSQSDSIENVIHLSRSDKTNFIYGGVFNKEVKADYIADDKFSVKNIEETTKATYPYAVGDKKYAFSVDNAEIGFDSVKVGYTQPAAKEVTITNEGNTPFTLKATENDAYIITIPSDAELEYGEYAKISIQPKEGLAVGNYAETLKIKTNVEGLTADIEVSFLVYQPTSGGSSKPVEEPEEPVVEPETPTEEPEAGEATVETEVTDGGEVELETPTAGGSAAADEDEAKITGVVLPTGTDSEVTFVPVSEQAAPEGKETQTKKVFEINVPTYEKGKAAVIKFTMTVAELAADGKEAADVALWHFDEETGEWTKLVTSYTIVDGVVYFEAITEDFSPFAIIYEDEPANEPVDEPETPASPAPVLAVLAGLGAAVVLRRK